MGRRRRYDLSSLHGVILRPPSASRPTVAYARVSSHDQKEDLVREVALLETFCAASGWTYEVIQDLGSGLNYDKKGLRDLINALCEAFNAEVVLKTLREGAEQP